jgi:putative SOS response-associated peptidase YedK
MPGPPQFGGQPITNIRNVSSPTGVDGSGRQTAALFPRRRSANTPTRSRARRQTWFALSYDRPLFAFAGLWTPWRCVQGHKSAPVDGEHELFGFLTTEANAVVAPIHPKGHACHSDHA